MYDKIKIAIIDDGVCEDFFNTKVEEKREITDSNSVIKQKSFEPLNPNHGSICAGIIKKYSPNAPIVSIKILNKEGRGELKHLVKSIEWCIINGIKIVNLSLGSIYYVDSCELRKTVKRAVKKGIIIIAGCSNEGRITYPSCFSDVIGVKTDFFNPVKEGAYVYNNYPNDGIEITASSIHKLILNDGTTYFTKPSNSYATPFITAKVYEIVLDNPNICVDSVKAMLIRGAINKSEIRQFYLYKNIDWIEKALIVQLNNKRLNSFDEELAFEVMDLVYIECDCFCKVTERIDKYFRYNEDIFRSIDTLIIDVELAEKHLEFATSDFIKYIIDLDKNVVYIDDQEIHCEISVDSVNPTSKIWHPSIFNHLNNPAISEIDIPLIRIYDFTGRYYIKIMKNIQKRFIKDGYNPILATDSCYGILYGMNYAPLINQSLLKDFDPGGLKSICGLFGPDLLLYGVDATKKTTTYYEYINKSIETDINIFIIDEINKKFEDCIKISKKSDQKSIVILSAGFEESLKLYNDIRVFKACNTYVDKVYKYILSQYS